MCDRVCVMYAGRIVEKALTDDLFANPMHPYTEGLIASVPHMDPTKKKERLFSIEGQPPNVIDLKPCCPFYPRCHKSQAVCEKAYPPKYEVNGEHSVSCWLYATEEQKKQALEEVNAR